MSFPLPNVDLSLAVVGATGKISLNNVGISAGGVSNHPSNQGKKATIFFFNDSGCGLRIAFSQSGQGFNLPAGGWVPIALPPGENLITYTVLYVLPSPPVSLLLLTYYPPDETIPQSMTLGNSPVGIGGSVQVSSVQTLSNEGGAAGGLVIDIGTVTIAQLIKYWTDHFSMSVQQAGVAHTVLQGQTAGNPLLIGQAGDNTEVLGALILDNGANVGLVRDNVNANTVLDLTAGDGSVKISKVGFLSHILGGLTVDQATTLTGVLTAPAANVLGAASVLTHILGTLTVDQLTTLSAALTVIGTITAPGMNATAASDLLLNADTGKAIRFRINGGNQGFIDATGLGIVGKKIFDSSTNNLIDWSAGGVFLKGNPLTHGGFVYQGDGSNSDWGMQAMSTGTATSIVGQTTVVHNLKQFGAAVAPDIVLFNDTSGGSMTINASAITTTQFTATAGQAHTYRWWAIKF